MAPDVSRLRSGWRSLNATLTSAYALPYRTTLARAQRDEDDLFRLLVASEALGIPSPAAYESAELLPLLLEDMHAWHTRMGLERSPMDHLSCC
ncbi:cory-CC-star protein [Demequina pelophila]|uniref:cory-CC-star protein n=1 Tax=Demequina pelophila TaxID=1638984 RepID=UPI000780865C|nr:cory-CC-star protein [Demequina pelophila]